MIALTAYKLSDYVADNLTIQTIPDVKRETIEENKVLFFDVKTTLFRNNCFFSLSTVLPELSLFYKQPKSFSKVIVNNFLRESSLYFAVQKDDRLNLLKEFFPVIVFFDSSNIILVARYVVDSEILAAQFSRQYSQVGTYMALLHKTLNLDFIKRFNKENRNKKGFVSYEQQRPFLITLKPFELDKLAKSDNPYRKQLVYFIRNTKIDGIQLLPKLRKEWEGSIEGLIHGDAKENNVLVSKKNGILDVTIVDFELACIGAWFWDISTLVASVLAKSVVPTTTNRGGISTDVAYDLIRRVCESYFKEKQLNDLDVQQDIQKRILRWSGVYFLQDFLHSESLSSLENGLALISMNDLCWEKIFTI